MLAGCTHLLVTAVPSTLRINTPSAWSKPQHDAVHRQGRTPEIGQIGTQFDGPGHIGVNTSKGMFFYNGRMFPESYERGGGGRAVGMGPSGVEHVGELGFVCRLVVLDAVAYQKSRGALPDSAEMLPIPTQPGDPGIITAADVTAMVEMQGLGEIGPGDCVALHT